MRPAWHTSLSRSRWPAVVTRAASVVHSIREELGESGAALAVELLIGNTLEAQGHKAIRKNDPNRLPEIYDPVFIHADADLDQVATGVGSIKVWSTLLVRPSRHRKNGLCPLVG